MSDETIQIHTLFRRGHARVRIAVVSGPHCGEEWIVDDANAISFGRGAPSQIRLDREVAFSREHCRLMVDPLGLRIEDLESTNGTWVNGMRVVSANLRDGDRFGVGDTFLTVNQITEHELPKPETAQANDRVQTPETELQETLITGDENSPRVPVAHNLELVLVQAMQPEPADVRGMPPEINDETALPASFSAETAAHGPEPFRESSPPNDEFLSRESQVVGPYELVREIGRGGMAIVYQAKHRRSGEVCAIKFIRTQIAPTEKQLSLFIREAGLLLRLVHPRIVRAHEFGFHEGTPYLAMEYLPTLPLAETVAKQPLEKRIVTSAWVVSRMLQALHFAHNQGIVHRDIKLANVLAYREGRHLQVKLGDFGLAKVYQDAGLTAMTNERSIRGTFAYMAPEQMRDSRSSQPSVDLFAAGVCLYQLIVGRLPLASMKPERYEAELEKLTDLPPELVDVLRKSMQLRPEDRYESAEAMAKAIFPFHLRP